jgi:hypothetical protein
MNNNILMPIIWATLDHVLALLPQPEKTSPTHSTSSYKSTAIDKYHRKECLPNSHVSVLLQLKYQVSHQVTITERGDFQTVASNTIQQHLLKLMSAQQAYIPHQLQKRKVHYRAHKSQWAVS